MDDSWVDDYSLITPTLEPLNPLPETGMRNSSTVLGTSSTQASTPAPSFYPASPSDTSNLYSPTFGHIFDYTSLTSTSTPLHSPISVGSDKGGPLSVEEDLIEPISMGMETYSRLMGGPKIAPTVDEWCMEAIAFEIQNTYPFRHIPQQFGAHSNVTSQPSDETYHLLLQDSMLHFNNWKLPFTRVDAPPTVTTCEVAQEYTSTDLIHRSLYDVECANGVHSRSADVELELPDFSSTAGTSKEHIAQESVSIPFWQLSQSNNAAMRSGSLAEPQDYSPRMQWDEFRKIHGDTTIGALSFIIDGEFKPKW